jgi:cytochrome c oxidase subunit 4
MSEHHEAHHSTFNYYVVYVLLMALLAATVWVAYFHLGVWAIPLALAIATVKAAMVIWYFMHVKDSSPMIGMCVGASLAGLLVGFIFLFSDYLSR